MALTVERLRNDSRFTGENVTQFLLFLPFGICLFVFRIFLALILWIAAIILPNKSTLGQMLSTLACWTFGVYVRVSGRRDERCSTLVGNCVSCLDSLAAAHALRAVSLRKWKVPPFFASTLGIRNAAQFVRKEHFGSSPSTPLLIQPEGGPSSGRGLLRFSEWPFPPPPRVQPVAITVERWFSAVTVQGSRTAGFPWRDALWFLLAPATVYRVRLLPPLAAPPARLPAAAAAAIAARLQIPVTDIEFSSLCRAPARPMQAAGASQELATRARQVKEVLPRVPLRDIMRDLAVTRSVDVTVTNFLEGVTPYAPEPAPGPSPSSPGAPSPSSPCSPPRAPFPRSARERQLSFQERKQQMIADARRRYVEKHGLDAALSG